MAADSRLSLRAGSDEVASRGRCRIMPRKTGYATVEISSPGVAFLPRLPLAGRVVCPSRSGESASGRAGQPGFQPGLRAFPDGVGCGASDDCGAVEGNKSTLNLFAQWANCIRPAGNTRLWANCLLSRRSPGREGSISQRVDAGGFLATKPLEQPARTESSPFAMPDFFASKRPDAILTGMAVAGSIRTIFPSRKAK